MQESQFGIINLKIRIISNVTVKEFGGDGGNVFSTIKSVGLRTGSYVDAIIINGVQYGGNGGSPRGELVLEEGEFIVKVEVRSGSFIDYLKLTRSKGRTLEGGGDGGSPSEFEGQVLAIAGRSGAYVDHLDFMVH